MKNSEFWRNMDHEFGSIYSHTLAESLALTELGSLSAIEALRKGIKPKQVWEAICRAQDLPPERWLGMDLEIKDP